MPTFLQDKDFDHDIFVSYATVDDDPLVGRTGWASELVRLLKKSLARMIGRRDSFELWFDQQKLRGHHKLSSEIRERVERSATLVVIASPGYHASTWCQEEREHFLRKFQGKLRNRIFVVERVPLSEDRSRPPGLDDMRGYRFWFKDQNDVARSLADPVPDPAEREYFRLIEDLAHDIVQQLKEMCGGEPPPSPSGGAVLLAEVTEDLEARREEMRRYLEQEEILVLPSSSYPGGGPEFEQCVKNDLRQSKLFVQLLSEARGRRPADIPEGYVWKQLELARQAKLEILHWRSPELDLASVSFPKQRELLELETVRASSFEGFKRAVADSAKRPPPPPPIPPPPQFVFINFEPRDLEIARKVRAELTKYVDVKIPITRMQSSEMREFLDNSYKDCDGLVFVYGQDLDWYDRQFSYFRKVAQSRPKPLHHSVLLDAPPPDKDEPHAMLRQMVIVPARDGIGQEVIARVVQALGLSEPASSP